MKLPVNKVPTRKQWQTLRDKSGGKKGLAKVSVGKSLDAFHDAVAKTERANDLAIALKAMADLEKDLKTYVAQISKKKEYNELSSTVKREMLAPIDKFRKAMQDMSKAGMKEIAAVEREIRMVIDETKKATDKSKNELGPLLKELSGMERRFSRGVKAEELKDLKRFLQDAAKVSSKWVKGAKSLNDTLVQLYKDHLRDHKPILTKYNSNLGKAKGSVEETLKEARRAQSYMELILKHAKK